MPNSATNSTGNEMTLREAAQLALHHLQVMRGAWQSGAVSAHDGHDGLYSSGNVEAETTLRLALEQTDGQQQITSTEADEMPALIAALRNQEPDDIDGVVVKVSRAACDIAADLLERLHGQRSISFATTSARRGANWRRMP
jgi:hypothetical protein